jgi:Arm DNA-binding domain
MGKLTAARLKSLTEPGRYSEGDGLFLEVKPGGGRSLVLRAQCGGKRRDIGLGSLKSVDLGDAREAAHQIRRQIARGLDAIAQVIPSFR